jgi:hypothetical protein
MWVVGCLPLVGMTGLALALDSTAGNVQWQAYWHDYCSFLLSKSLLRIAQAVL